MRIHQISTRAGESAKKATKGTSHPQPHPAARRVTFGVIVGNRGFFPGHLARDGRKEMTRRDLIEATDFPKLEPAPTPVACRPSA